MQIRKRSCSPSSEASSAATEQSSSQEMDTQSDSPFISEPSPTTVRRSAATTTVRRTQLKPYRKHLCVSDVEDSPNFSKSRIPNPRDMEWPSEPTERLQHYVFTMGDEVGIFEESKVAQFPLSNFQGLSFERFLTWADAFSYYAYMFECGDIKLGRHRGMYDAPSIIRGASQAFDHHSALTNSSLRSIALAAKKKTIPPSLPSPSPARRAKAPTLLSHPYDTSLRPASRITKPSGSEHVLEAGSTPSRVPEGTSISDSRASAVGACASQPSGSSISQTLDETLLSAAKSATSLAALSNSLPSTPAHRSNCRRILYPAGYDSDEVDTEALKFEQSLRRFAEIQTCFENPAEPPSTPVIPANSLAPSANMCGPTGFNSDDEKLFDDLEEYSPEIFDEAYAAIAKMISGK
ncbi:hypothetical protein CPC08DRAFT_767861 [Agrocybe pediades]|nr:hypothetical protein CPC08DRAFT_767861 [Agrocybe pediades]